MGQKLSPNARIIWGCRVEPDMEKVIRVMLVVTGLKEGPNVLRGTGGTMDTHLDMVR